MTTKAQRINARYDRVWAAVEAAKRNTIKRAYIRQYRDNGQTIAYVEWSDGSRTEGTAHIMGDKPGGNGWLFTCGTHMTALLARAEREGLAIEREIW